MTTTDETSTYSIIAGGDDHAGQAPGTSRWQALETFNSDALDGAGTMEMTANGARLVHDGTWYRAESPALADPHAPNFQLVDEYNAKAGLLCTIDEAGDATIAAAMWAHATIGFQATSEDEPTEENVAERVSAAYATLYGLC